MVSVIVLLFGMLFIALGWLFIFLAKTDDDDASYRRNTIACVCFIIGIIIIFVALGVSIGMHI